ncbi:hypothetical protein [Clostridium sp. AM58-1XD]|uniref:hypothetical protein n=1 Tax=Clostridium sp. AM58-1XD TaxID=2292307 RepID=UPI001FA8ABD3|nr:hypothetical protein [Clostridium sp. AM58-1XD]
MSVEEKNIEIQAVSEKRTYSVQEIADILQISRSMASTIHDIHKVLHVLKFTCRPECYDYYMMHCSILIAVGCTLRGGEIGGLQWDRV